MARDESFLTKTSREHCKKSKKKNHKKGFNENFDTFENRKQRINFKNYLKELEEASLEDDLLDDE